VPELLAPTYRNQYELRADPYWPAQSASSVAGHESKPLAWRGAAAYAANVHVKSGPAFSDNGVTLTAVGELAGLGMQDLVVSMTAVANQTATCTNPSGQNQPPGQNPAPIGRVATPEVIPASEAKNGNTAFSLATIPPPSPVAGAPDCPNGRWTETITDLQFTSATISVEQPAGTVVLIISCTFAPATMGGPVSKQTVTCN